MIRLFVYSLLAIITALILSLYSGFPGDPGYLLVAFGNYTFETSLFALFTAFAIAYVLIRVLFVVFNWVNPWHLIRYGKDWRKMRKAKKRSTTTEGLLYLVRGSWHSSYSLLNKSKNDADATVVNYLAAAYAAYELGDRETWMQLLQSAEEEYPAAKSTINSLKAQLLFKSNQLEQCLAVLEELRKHSLNDATLLQLLKKVYVKLEDWEKLGALVPTLEKLKVVDSEESEQIQKRVFVELLYGAMPDKQADTQSGTQAGMPDSVTADEAEVAALYKLWKKAPAKFKEDEKVVRHYADLLIKLGEKTAAAKAIELFLSRNFSDAMVLRYGELEFGNKEQQLIQAEAWLKSRPGNANLLLSLGRICMRNQLWGKAREYYDTSIKIAPSAQAYGELARLLKSLGEFEASEIYTKHYADLIGSALPDLPMPTVTQVTH